VEFSSERMPKLARDSTLNLISVAVISAIMRNGTNSTFHSTAREACAPSEGAFELIGFGIMWLYMSVLRGLRAIVVVSASRHFTILRLHRATWLRTGSAPRAPRRGRATPPEP